MRISLVSTRLLAVASFLAWHMAAAFHQRPSDIEIKKTLLRTAGKDGRYVSRMLQTEGLFGEAEVTPSDGANTEYYVFTLTDPTTCIPKPPSNGCDCGTSHAFLMSDTKSSSLECVQLWSDNDTFVTTVNMANNDTLMFDVRPSSTNANVINAFNTSWWVLNSQVQPFSKVINEAAEQNKSFIDIEIVGTPDGAKATASNDLRTNTTNLTNSTIPNVPIAICRAWVDPENSRNLIPIPDSDIKAYTDKNVQVQFSSIPVQQYQEGLEKYNKALDDQKIISLTGQALTSVASIPGLFEVAPQFAQLSHLAGSILSLTSIGLSFNNPPDPLPAFLQQSFTAINENIQKLAELIRSIDLSEIRKDIAETTLDLLMDSLQSIDESFNEMMLSFQTGSLPVIRYYTEKYRRACNVPHRQPQDVARSLYGFACGNVTSTINCDDLVTSNRGACNYGQRKMNDIFTLYMNSSNYETQSFLYFSTWMYSALLLAQFHHSACLPLASDACNDKATDPVFNQTSFALSQAITEAIGNLKRVVTCFNGYPARSITNTFIKQHTDATQCGIICANFPNCNVWEQCVGSQLLEYIQSQEQYQPFHWHVTVFSFNDESDIREITDPKNPQAPLVSFSKDREIFGNYGTKLIGGVKYDQGRRETFFHIMYVAKDKSLALDQMNSRYSISEENLLNEDFAALIPFSDTTGVNYIGFRGDKFTKDGKELNRVIRWMSISEINSKLSQPRAFGYAGEQLVEGSLICTARPVCLFNVEDRKDWSDEEPYFASSCFNSVYMRWDKSCNNGL